MEGSSLRAPVDDGLILKTSKGAGIGLAAGSVWGLLVSMLHNGPKVGSNVKYPELVRTGKVCRSYAGTLAILGATYVGVEQSLERVRGKKDIINGAVAGFAAGATMGFRAGRLRTLLVSGSALALTSVLLDVTGMRTTEEEEKAENH
ncbi:hypothetical protein CFC21_065503 [Triticum aestivum]|uniref:Mitochondrial import inner membrane translocase subunit TIM22 n=3 Tax=Triticum TaxID=4564 RepID=A0A9R0WND1_TRITD|nr:outer envelope pore protein 16-3, chloroplastic/mitochondrial-like [Triticum aestivum]XP_044384896.1 outer envelope pore protein 16-3, chloroplastic/mitochondrial-like [Triticum aestivum]KAF7058438.1 hypothetical protein CFC21_065503 [Triticum aestivum]VAI17088.1 unnamed protein product [Triticum turgidum subsp. durum]